MDYLCCFNQKQGVPFTPIAVIPFTYEKKWTSE